MADEAWLQNIAQACSRRYPFVQFIRLLHEHSHTHNPRVDGAALIRGLTGNPQSLHEVLVLFDLPAAGEAEFSPGYYYGILKVLPDSFVHSFAETVFQ